MPVSKALVMSFEAMGTEAVNRLHLVTGEDTTWLAPAAKTQLRSLLNRK